MYLSDIEVILICGIICWALYWYLTNNFDYWKKRNVVHDRPYPVLGTSFKQLLMIENASLILQKLYNKYPNEDVVGGFMSKKPILILRNPDIIKQVLVKDFNHFQDHAGLRDIDVDRDPLLQHLFLSTGDTWKVLRQKLSPTFTSGKLKNGFPLLTECGKEFQKYIHDIVEDCQEFDIKELMAKFTTDVIGTYAFGMKMNSMKDESAPFRVMGRKIFEPSVDQRLKIIVNLVWPSLFNFLGFRITPLEIQTFFINLFKSVVNSRKNEPSIRHDFVDLLIQLKSKGYIESDKPHQDATNIDNSNIIKLTDDVLAAQAFIFFTAGYETSSTTMTFALYELSKNPLVQNNLTEEIDRIMMKYSGQITYEGLKEMNYLQMVIDETLRMYPPLGILDRICVSPYRFPNTDISLDKGVLINIPIYAIQHDPKYYPDPEKFIPERFTHEEILKRHPCVYLPFGDGPRQCIGLRFAKIQTMVGLISILEHYSVEANSKTVPKIELSKVSFILASESSILLSLKPRKTTTKK